MAGIDAGGGGGSKRPLNQEIPLIPFIDFLLCLVSFLLITAVWSQMAVINANAQVPGPPNDQPLEEQKKDKTLHLEMKGDQKFQLVWKEGTTVVNTIDVERKQVPVGTEGEYTYPDLAKKIADEWQQNGSHRAASDLKLDQAVLHTDNTTPFQDIIAVIDALYTPKREFKIGSDTKNVPAFNVTFAVN